MRGKALLVITVCVFGLFLILSSSTLPNSALLTTPRKVMASNVELTIDYGNTTQVSYTSLTGSTVFDILNQTTTVTYTQYPYGLFIESINGISNNEGGSGFYWQYWVNEELAPVAADQYVLSDSSKVLWKYCAPIHTSDEPLSTRPDWWVGAALIVCVAGLVIGGAFVINRKLW